MAEAKIISSAIHYDDGVVYVHQPTNISKGFVIAGRRHHNCVTTLAILAKISGFERTSRYKETQGFLTSDDRFVDRKEAAKIAMRSGQVRELKHRENELDSSDLY